MLVLLITYVNWGFDSKELKEYFLILHKSAITYISHLIERITYVYWDLTLRNLSHIF